MMDQYHDRDLERQIEEADAEVARSEAIQPTPFYVGDREFVNPEWLVEQAKQLATESLGEEPNSWDDAIELAEALEKLAQVIRTGVMGEVEDTTRPGERLAGVRYLYSHNKGRPSTHLKAAEALKKLPFLSYPDLYKKPPPPALDPRRVRKEFPPAKHPELYDKKTGNPSIKIERLERHPDEPV